MPANQGKGRFDVSVVIPSFNRLEMVRECIGAVAKQEVGQREFEIVVVDDGSDPPYSTDYLVQGLADVSVHVIRGLHLGPAAARNRGIAASSAPILAFIDDDCIPCAGWLAELVLPLSVEGGPVATEGQTFSKPADSPMDQFVSNAAGGGYQTCNLAVRRSVLEDVGRFDEQFRFPYREDTDLAARLLKRGAILFCERARVFHRLRRATMHSAFHSMRYMESDVRLALKYDGEALRTVGFSRAFLLVPKRHLVFYTLVGLATLGVVRGEQPLWLGVPFLLYPLSISVPRIGRATGSLWTRTGGTGKLLIVRIVDLILGPIIGWSYYWRFRSGK